jgi:hypothetical protein
MRGGTFALMSSFCSTVSVQSHSMQIRVWKWLPGISCQTNRREVNKLMKGWQPCSPRIPLTHHQPPRSD